MTDREMTDLITDVIFTEATQIVLDDTNDETVQRVAAIMSMCSKQLAERVVEALQLTETKGQGETMTVKLFGIEFADEQERDKALLELKRSLDRITQAENDVNNDKA